jgi:hypothetical protein
MFRVQTQRLASTAVLAALLGGQPVPVLAAPSPASSVPVAPATVQVQAPEQITVSRPFAVSVHLSGPAGAQPAVTLSLIDPGQPAGLTLGGTLQAPLVNGAATFNGVIINGKLEAARNIRLVAVALDGEHTVSGASGAIQLQPAPLASYHDSSVTFDSIPNQPNYGLFQISLHVLDSTGQPLPAAHVSVTLDPRHNKAHFLFITTDIALKDAAGRVVDAIEGTTDANGVATMWVRLGSNTTPYHAAFVANTQWQGKPLNAVTSNVFEVFNPSP